MGRKLFCVSWGVGGGREGREGELGQIMKDPEHTCFILEIMGH